MRKLVLVMSLLPVGALAQTETDAAYRLVLPMIEEIQPGPAAQILTTCIVSSATAEEIASFAAAAGPSAEIGAVINGILARPETAQCIEAAVQG